MADEPKKPLGEKNDIQDLIALMQQNMFMLILHNIFS